MRTQSGADHDLRASQAMLSQLLVQFVFRVSFGTTLAMAVTSGRQVTSGFFRVHLWVLMGLNTLSALVLYSQHAVFSATLDYPAAALSLAIAIAIACYLVAVCWLYEQAALGGVGLLLISLASLVASCLTSPLDGGGWWSLVLLLAALSSSGWLLGVTLAAMFLGHWYLNTPTMQLRPLQRLIQLMIGAILMRALVSGTGLGLEWLGEPLLPTQFWIFVSFRWLSGIIGTFVFALMAWWSLKVPNTQSATGILYAAVVVVFLGELTSQLLSADAQFPL